MGDEARQSRPVGVVRFARRVGHRRDGPWQWVCGAPRIEKPHHMRIVERRAGCTLVIKSSGMLESNRPNLSFLCPGALLHDAIFTTDLV